MNKYFDCWACRAFQFEHDAHSNCERLTRNGMTFLWFFSAFSNIFLYRYTPTILRCPNSFFIRLLCRVVRPFRTALCASYLICLAHFRASQMPSRTRLFSFFLPKRLTFTFRERLCKLFTFYALCVSCVYVHASSNISLVRAYRFFVRELWNCLA